jgi:hypothetical protein
MRDQHGASNAVWGCSQADKARRPWTAGMGASLRKACEASFQGICLAKTISIKQLWTVHQSSPGPASSKMVSPGRLAATASARLA